RPRPRPHTRGCWSWRRRWRWRPATPSRAGRATWGPPWLPCGRGWRTASEAERYAMRVPSLGLLGATLAVCLIPAGPARANAVGAWPHDFAFKVKRVTAVRPSPDGRRVAFVVGTAAMDGEKSEWVSQVWVADGDGGNALQLTRGERSSTAP